MSFILAKFYIWTRFTRLLPYFAKRVGGGVCVRWMFDVCAQQVLLHHCFPEGGAHRIYPWYVRQCRCLCA
jgi:hypothetical protein